MTIGERQFVYMAMMEDSVYQVKIGHTLNPMVREKHLFAPGVSAPYHMLHVWEVEDMVWVEEQVIFPALNAYRVPSGKEIFNLDWMYPSLIDHSIIDAVNGLNLANTLSGEIDSLLTQRGIQFQRCYINSLEEYDFILQEQKKFNSFGSKHSSIDDIGI